MPILDNNQQIINFNGGGIIPMNVALLPNSFTGNQNSTSFTFTEIGSDVPLISRRVYTFSNEGFSQTSNPSFVFASPGVRKVSAYFYSDSTSKVGYAETNVTVFQPTGYTCDLISACTICAALTKESSAYTGPLVRLLRESDWQTADIPYNSFDTLDTASATTFLSLPVDNTLSGLPLDIMSATKSMGYSTMRKLRTSYTGNCMTIRRSSDNVTTDIGFNPSGFVEVSAITSFLTGSTTGFCTTLYNQGTLGSAGDWIQSTQVNQPVVDVTSFGYPTIDMSDVAGTYRGLGARTQLTVTSNYTNISKINLLFKLKAKVVQTVASPISLRFTGSLYMIYQTGAPSNFTLNGFFGSVTASNGFADGRNWSIYTQRVRMDSSTFDRRYIMMGLDSLDGQSPIANSATYKISPVSATINSWGLNWTSLANSFQGWFSELIIDDTDLSLNQFYKIKKYMAENQSINYSAETRTGLRVQKIYNQKSTTGEDYIQNSISNMPEFIINNPNYSNRPSIFSRNTLIGDVATLEPRISSLTLNNSGNAVVYSNQYTLISLYRADSGTTLTFNTKSSSNAQTQTLYFNRTGSATGLQWYNNSNNNIIGSISFGTNLGRFSIDSYRQVVSNGLRWYSWGTNTFSASTAFAGGTLNTPRTLLFHQFASPTNAWRGDWFFDMSFEAIPTESDYSNLIYPPLRDKYGATN